MFAICLSARWLSTDQAELSAAQPDLPLACEAAWHGVDGNLWQLSFSAPRGHTLKGASSCATPAPDLISHPRFLAYVSSDWPRWTNLRCTEFCAPAADPNARLSAESARGGTAVEARASGSPAAASAPPAAASASAMPPTLRRLRTTGEKPRALRRGRSL